MPDSMKQFYETYWSRRIEKNHTYQKNIPRRFKIIKNMAGKNKRILDVGCGNGVLTKMIAKNNYVVGIDISRRAIESVNESYAIDVENDELDFEPFDVIVMSEVIEHLINPEKAVEKLKPLLKESGSFIIDVPNFTFWLQRLRMLKGVVPHRNQGHLHNWNYTDFKKFLNGCGLRIVEEHRNCAFPLNSYMPVGDLLGRVFPDLFSSQPVFRCIRNDY